MQKDASPVRGPDHVLKDLLSKAQDKWATTQQQRTAPPPVEKHAQYGAPEMAAPAMHGTPVPPFKTARSEPPVTANTRAAAPTPAVYPIKAASAAAAPAARPRPAPAAAECDKDPINSTSAAPAKVREYFVQARLQMECEVHSIRLAKC